MKINMAIRTHMRRSPYQTFAAILTMFVTFLVSGFFFLTTVSSVQILHYFESKPQITVFFEDTAGEKEATSLKLALEGTGQIASTEFVSKEDALVIYREQNKNDPLLLEMVTADILPASLEVSATDPKYLSTIEPIIQKADGVEEVVYQRDVVETLLSWTSAIRSVGGLLALLLIINSLLIIMTVIAMKVALKREEIDILKLVGASLWYIRLPFVVEGALYGAIGAFGAGSILAGFIAWLRPFILTFVGQVPSIGFLLSPPVGVSFILATAGFVGGMVIVGLFLGGIGSLIALARYLKF